MLKKVNKAAVAQLVEHHVANVNVTSSSLVSRSNLRLYCAAVAQLVEHHVANVNVTSSSLVSRSNSSISNKIIKRPVQLIRCYDLLCDIPRRFIQIFV